jgi:hypothetical protein
LDVGKNRFAALPRVIARITSLVDLQVRNTDRSVRSFVRVCDFVFGFSCGRFIGIS